ARAELGSREHLPPKDEIVRGKHLSIVPSQVRAKDMGCLHGSIGRDSPAVCVEPWQLLFEIRVGNVVFIELVESSVEQAQRGVERPGIAHERLCGETGWFAPRDDDQRSLR